MPTFTKKYSTCWVWGKAHGSLGLTFIYYQDRDTKKEFSSIRTATVQIWWQMVTEACFSIGETRMSGRDWWNGECVPHLNWAHTQCLSLVPWSPEGQGLSDLMLFWKELEIRIFMQHFLLKAQNFPEESLSQNKHLQTKFIPQASSV